MPVHRLQFCVSLLGGEFLKYFSDGDCVSCLAWAPALTLEYPSPSPLPRWCIAMFGLAENSLQNPAVKELRYQNPSNKGFKVVAKRALLNFAALMIIARTKWWAQGWMSQPVVNRRRSNRGDQSPRRHLPLRVGKEEHGKVGRRHPVDRLQLHRTRSIAAATSSLNSSALWQLALDPDKLHARTT